MSSLSENNHQSTKHINQETECQILDKNLHKNSNNQDIDRNNDLNENVQNDDDNDNDNENSSGNAIEEEEEECNSQFEESTHEYDDDEFDQAHDDYYDDYYSDYDSMDLPNSSSNQFHHYHKSQGNQSLSRTSSNGHKHHSKKHRACTSDQRLNPKTEEGRKVIAHQTLKINKRGKYTFRRKDNIIEEIDISSQIIHCVKHTKTYRPNYYYSRKGRNPTVKKRKRACKIEVVPESTFGSAKRLVKKEKIYRTCVLNFASATKPGGGFKNGRTAQEESLSRQSALYESLKKHPEMYKYNLKHSTNDSFYNDYMIYSSKVPVFRSDISERLFGKNEIFVTSVITSAAPNLKDVSKYQQNRKNYKKIFYERCRKILLLAIERHNDAIVLGAYGCGVFENDPKFVSSVFKKLLFKGKNGDEPLCKYFSKVVFAIIGCKSENFQIFSKKFKDYINPRRK